MRSFFLFKKIAFALFLSLFTLPVPAQVDHLEPVSGILGAYEFELTYRTMIRQVLFKDLSGRPSFRIVVTPSFAEEYVLSCELEQAKEQHYLIYRRAEESIWNRSQGYSNGTDPIRTRTYRLKIDSTAHEQLSELFYVALRQVKYPPPRDSFGVDGTTYRFMSSQHHPRLEGKVWSPQEDSKMGRLVQIVHKLCAYTEVPNRKKLRLLMPEVKALTEEIRLSD